MDEPLSYGGTDPLSGVDSERPHDSLFLSNRLEIRDVDVFDGFGGGAFSFAHVLYHDVPLCVKVRVCVNVHVCVTSARVCERRQMRLCARY